MKTLRVRSWLKLHQEREIVLNHQDYERLGHKTVMKIIRTAPYQQKLVSVQSQSFNQLSGAGKPGAVFSNILKEMVR